MDLNILKPSDYGVDFIGTVYFCKRELIEKSPELVQAFVNAMADGWDAALKDPKKAIAYLKTYDKNIEETKELASLIDSVEYYRGEGGKLLDCNEATWTQMASLLQGIGAIKGPFQFAENVDPKFVDAHHAQGTGK